MVQDPQVARDDLVLEPRAVRDVDPVSVVGHDDHRALRSPGSQVTQVRGHTGHTGHKGDRSVYVPRICRATTCFKWCA